MDILSTVKEQGQKRTELPAWLGMRYAWRKNDEARDAGNRYPADVIQIKNLDYKEPFDEKRFLQAMREAEEAGHHPQEAPEDQGIPVGWYAPAGAETDPHEESYASNSRLDLYLPKERPERLPILINVHGGGWFYGDKELYSYYGCHLAESGFAVVNFNYRLSPQNKYPAAVIDVAACVRFVYEYAKLPGLDRENLFMVGDSAGAQLTTNYCILAANEAYRKQVDFPTYDVLPKAVCLNCGGYEMDSKEGEIYDWYVKREDGSFAVEPEALSLFHAQLSYMNDKFPPTYLMYSVNDPLKDSTIRMEERMTKLGILHEMHAFGEGHPECAHVFHLDLKHPVGQRCNREEIEFLKRYIGWGEK